MIYLQTYGGQGVECGSFEYDWSHNLIVNGTLGAMALLEWVVFGWNQLTPAWSETPASPSPLKLPAVQDPA